MKIKAIFEFAYFGVKKCRVRHFKSNVGSDQERKIPI